MKKTSLQRNKNPVFRGSFDTSTMNRRAR